MVLIGGSRILLHRARHAEIQEETLGMVERT
jgi:hypothetical protein